ncbi:MAG: AMP-binding protein, partial [Myxococcota bacterium]
MASNSGSSIRYRAANAIHTQTYAECYRTVQRLTRCFKAHGLEAGDRIAIHGDTSYYWLLADLTAVYLGLVSVALYPAATRERASSILRETGCKLVLTDQPDSGQYFAEQGIAVLLLAETEHEGFETLASHLDDEPEILEPVPRPSPSFTIVSTSGTLSEPKLFAVTAAPLLTTMHQFAELYGLSAADRLLVFLPMSHLPQRMLVYGALDIEMDLILSSPNYFLTDSCQSEATVTVTVPRVIEHLDTRIRGSATHKDLFGDKIRLMFVGSAPIRPALLEKWKAMGAPLFEVYGTTEIGMVGLNRPGFERPGTVGWPIPWGDVKLDPETNEILVKTTTPFLHSRLIDGEMVVAEHGEDHYYSTGDVGKINEDGSLRVLGRLRDFIALQSGEKIFVRDIEERLVEAGLAPLCLLVGNGQRHLSALLFFAPDDEHLARRDELEARSR